MNSWASGVAVERQILKFTSSVRSPERENFCIIFCQFAAESAPKPQTDIEDKTEAKTEAKEHKAQGATRRQLMQSQPERFPFGRAAGSRLAGICHRIQTNILQAR